MVFCVNCVCLMSWVRKLQSTVRTIYPNSTAHYLEFAGFVVIHQPVAAYPKHRAWFVSVHTADLESTGAFGEVNTHSRRVRPYQIPGGKPFTPQNIKVTHS